ncbi:unnamed protein product [Clonostachys rosea]|uniref:Uncharacterized protein n=1 Tax=Bionectria ochroleuca TaxID=29856 RepID=A0ABY6V4K8_BIOOC|nr:unnamed protein product [Clonostachys rosea]
MLDEAQNGPIVTLNISSFRCDALIIHSSGIPNLELSSVTLEEVQQYKSDPMSTKTMEWLWDNIVFPVLAYLDMAEQVSTNQLLPHIWWVPTVPIIGAPLHAAGYHFQENSETALDKVISSYSLSVTAIIKVELSVDKG